MLTRSERTPRQPRRCWTKRTQWSARITRQKCQHWQPRTFRPNRSPRSRRKPRQTRSTGSTWTARRSWHQRFPRRAWSPWRPREFRSPWPQGNGRSSWSPRRTGTTRFTRQARSRRKSWPRWPTRNPWRSWTRRQILQVPKEILKKGRTGSLDWLMHRFLSFTCFTALRRPFSYVFNWVHL